LLARIFGRWEPKQLALQIGQGGLVLGVKVVPELRDERVKPIDTRRADAVSAASSGGGCGGSDGLSAGRSGRLDAWAGNFKALLWPAGRRSKLLRELGQCASAGLDGGQGLLEHAKLNRREGLAETLLALLNLPGSQGELVLGGSKGGQRRVRA
jgi:hypothetical protein